jgi:formate--tetrahydrofolate ligase
MPSDIEIAQKAKLIKIFQIASERLGIPEDDLEPYGRFKAKISLKYLESLKSQREGHLILVTAISPTPAGEGKTTTTIGLGDALNRIGKKAIICLREPSLGPVFGVKGGAAGGGYSQIVPMEDINLHFTGDFSAIALANNLLSALLDNHIHHGNALDIDTRRIVWRRVVDMNDRALRSTVVGMGGAGNGFVRQEAFDIVVASEVMAIFCLATSLEDLKQRLGDIIVAHTRAGAPVVARDLRADGAMAALLRDALAPNLVQTLEGGPALVHGGPFANIAHGCNSVLATRAALRLADYAVTEAGFGADLGAEKFMGIKCAQAGLRPAACVVVATVRALKHHGSAPPPAPAAGAAAPPRSPPPAPPAPAAEEEDLGALERGLANLERHIRNLQEHLGLRCVVAVNRFAGDTPAELALVARRAAALGAAAVVADHWARGGAGAEDLAREVVRLAEGGPGVPGVPPVGPPRAAYEPGDALWEKLRKVATKIYGADGVSAPPRVRRQLDEWQAAGRGGYPVCVAKTPASFSTDPARRGAPTGHTLDVREVRLSAGARFVVAVCGEVLTMPGLPASPAAERIDVGADGRIVGLF